MCTLFKNAGEANTTYTNKNYDGRKNPGIWYDSDCRDKKKVFDMYEKQFRISGLDEDRIDMCKARNIYRKCCRNKRRMYQIAKAQELN